MISRPNRFIMMVDIDGKIEKCHCPVTGRIGSIEFNKVPCLLSLSDNAKRSTQYTVEAISLDAPKKKKKAWIGINQVAINRYMDFFFRHNLLANIVDATGDVKREVKLKDSRIDFKVNNTFIEIKMPLISLFNEQVDQKKSKFNSFERLIKHFKDLSSNNRAVLILCFIYKAPPFEAPKTDNSNRKIKTAVSRALRRGVEIWQANLSLDPSGVKLEQYFKLNNV